MTTKAEISNEIESVIHAELLAKYSHLSFADIAKFPDLNKLDDELRPSETDWIAAQE